MSGFFSLEGGLFSAMGKIFDIMFVSLLWLVFSLPIVTIGASTTALYYTTAKVIRRERGYLFGEFWRSFKENLLSGVIYSVIIIAICLLFYFNFQVINKVDSTITTILFYVYWVMMYLVFSCVVYLFPVLSRFNLKRVEMVKMSLLLSMKHLPNTLMVQLWVVIGGVLIIFIPLTTCFVPALVALFCSFSLEKVFRLYMPKPEKKYDEDGNEIEEVEDRSEWYMTF